MRKISRTATGKLRKRHQGRFNPEHPAPYELSRGRIENFVSCPVCFWLEQKAGVEFPSIPGFNLNTNTDILLKRAFDAYRGADVEQTHPLLTENNLAHIFPFDHPDLDKWTDSMRFGASENHFNTIHEESNILFGGGLDDCYENRETGELHIVDYKSTAQLASEENIKTLDESFLLPPKNLREPDYKAAYRRQMDMYQWIMRRKMPDKKVSDIGYFVYVDGQHHGLKGMIDIANPSKANMEFNVAVIPYKADDSWVEQALVDAKRLLLSEECPSLMHSTSDKVQFILDVKKALGWSTLQEMQQQQQ